MGRRSETFLMMRTLRDMNMSKFVAEDVPLFLSLLDDLFPGVKADRTQFAQVSEALEKVRLRPSSLLWRVAGAHWRICFARGGALNSRADSEVEIMFVIVHDCPSSG